jgi:hypothetical protein
MTEDEDSIDALQEDSTEEETLWLRTLIETVRPVPALYPVCIKQEGLQWKKLQ